MSACPTQTDHMQGLEGVLANRMRWQKKCKAKPEGIVQALGGCTLKKPLRATAAFDAKFRFVATDEDAVGQESQKHKAQD